MTLDFKLKILNWQVTNEEGKNGFISFRQRKSRSSFAKKKTVHVDLFCTACFSITQWAPKKGLHQITCAHCNEQIFHLGYLKNQDLPILLDEALKRHAVYEQSITQMARQGHDLGAVSQMRASNTVINSLKKMNEHLLRRS